MHVSIIILFLVEGVILAIGGIYVVKSLAGKTKSSAAQQVFYAERMYQAYSAFYYILGAWLLGWLLLTDEFDFRQRLAGVILVSVLFWVMPEMKKLFLDDVLERLQKADACNVGSEEGRSESDFGFTKFFLKKLIRWGVLLSILLVYWLVVSIFDKTATNPKNSVLDILKIVGVIFLAGIPVAAGLSFYNLIKNKKG